MFRVSMFIDGDADTAKAALSETAAATRATGDAARAASGPTRALGEAQARAAGQGRAMGAAVRGGTVQVGQLGAQFNDIGVQLAAGTSPLLVAVQQGTQISQAIGPLGAAGAVRALGAAFQSVISPVALVTIGAIAAGGALTQMLFSGGRDADSFEKSMENLEGSVDAYRSAVDLAVAPTSKLEERFGTAAPKARELAEALGAIAGNDALRDIEARADGIAGLFGRVDSDFFGRAAADFFDARRSGGTQVIEDFRQSLDDLKNASGLDEIDAALTQTIEKFRTAADLSGSVTAEEEERLRIFLELQKEIQKTRATTEDLDPGQRANAAIRALNEEARAAALSARERAARNAVAQAGLEITSQEGARVAEAARATFDQVEAADAATRAAERKAEADKRGRESVVDLIGSLDQELAILRASDPVQREMIRLRADLANATIDEADAIRDKITALEEERRAQQLGNALDDLAFREEVARLSDREAFIRRELRSADIQDPQSDVGRRVAAQAGRTFDAEAERAAARRGARGSRGAAAREADRQAESIDRVFTNLRDERDLMLEMDPVQREMIRLRGALTGATQETIDKVEQQVATNIRLADTLEAQRGLYDVLAFSAFDALDGIILRGGEADDVLKDLGRSLANTVLQATLLGQGPLAGIFGTKDSGGLFGSAFGALLGGAEKKADGGRIRGVGGPRDDLVPILASNGEFVVNAQATARNLPLLEAINSGSARFADGGRVGGPVFAPPPGGAAGTGAGGRDRVERIEIDLRLSDDVDARINTTSERVATRVSRENINRFSDSVLPIRSREIDRNGGVIG